MIRGPFYGYRSVSEVVNGVKRCSLKAASLIDQGVQVRGPHGYQDCSIAAPLTRCATSGVMDRAASLPPPSWS